MSKTSTKVILALLAVLAAPAASFARTAGEAGMGNVPISGIPAGPANVGGMNNASVDPSGIGNANQVAPIPPPPIPFPPLPPSNSAQHHRPLPTALPAALAP